MPYVRYRLQVFDDFWDEKEYVLPSKDVVEQVAKEIVRPLQERREKLGEPVISLIKVDVLDPFTHPHDWKCTVKQGDWWCYQCQRCGIVSHRIYRFPEGCIGEFIRDKEWASKKHEYCHDPLKEMPQAKGLF